LLAHRGLSFTHAYAQPNCAPTRAAMLSGQYPARVNNDYCEFRTPRLGEVKKKQIQFETHLLSPPFQKMPNE